jgi:hypothetical protein
MARTRAWALTVLAGAVAAGAAGCGTPSQASIRIDPQTLAFTHIIGTSPCPQVVGRFTVRNTGSENVLVSGLNVSGPLTASPTRGDIPPNGSLEITVFFDCSRRTDFVGSVQVDVGDGTSLTAAVTVQGTVR